MCDRCEYCQEIVLEGLKCGCKADLEIRALRAERQTLLEDAVEVVALRIRISELEEAIRPVIRRHDEGTLSGPGDSASIERLRALVS